MVVGVGENVHFRVGGIFGFPDFKGSLLKLFDKEFESVLAFFGIWYVGLVDDSFGGFLICLTGFQS
jgi:hypothetical protein